MRRTRIIFIDASIERVPKRLWKHPAIASDSRRRGRHPSKILLYIPIHYTALKDHNISIVKRGRPDIIHRALITTLDSPLNKENMLEIHVHTIENILIKVDRSMRIPLDYYRFEGLLIQLLEEGRVPPKGSETFLKKEDEDLLDLLRRDEGHIYLMSEEGEEIDDDIASNMVGNTILIGAFQNGKFSKEIMDEADHIISISPYTHLTSIVTCHLLTYLYRIIMEKKVNYR